MSNGKQWTKVEVDTIASVTSKATGVQWEAKRRGGARYFELHLATDEARKFPHAHRWPEEVTYLTVYRGEAAYVTVNDALNRLKELRKDHEAKEAKRQAKLKRDAELDAAKEAWEKEHGPVPTAIKVVTGRTQELTFKLSVESIDYEKGTCALYTQTNVKLADLPRLEERITALLTGLP